VGGARRRPWKPPGRLCSLTGIQAALQGQKGFDWATQVEIQRRAAAGLAGARREEGCRSAGPDAIGGDLEDSTDKHPVTPGSILPAREQLADLLSELGQRPRRSPVRDVAPFLAGRAFNS